MYTQMMHIYKTEQVYVICLNNNIIELNAK